MKKAKKKPTFQALTHHTSPYSSDYIQAKMNVGLEPEFQTRSKGKGNARASVTRMANGMIDRMRRELNEAKSLGIDVVGKTDSQLKTLIRKAKNGNQISKSA